MRGGQGTHGKESGACSLCERIPEPGRPVETCQACSAVYHTLCWKELGPRCRACQAQLCEEVTTGAFHERRRLPLDLLTGGMIVAPLVGLLVPTRNSLAMIVGLIALLTLGLLLACYVVWRGLRPRVVVTDEVVRHHVFPGVVQEVGLDEIAQARLDDDSLTILPRQGPGVRVALRRRYYVRLEQIETPVFSDEVQGRLMSLLEARGVAVEQGRSRGSARRRL